ncbi:hypothetical protein ACLOJK_007033 [Asimina triloba]
MTPLLVISLVIRALIITTTRVSVSKSVVKAVSVSFRVVMGGTVWASVPTLDKYRIATPVGGRYE